jgi:phosphodiesterase/alkaline phosphatase D-like protein
MTLTDEERKAALRFCETCEDGEGYDVSKTMMKRLVVLDLVAHKGGGWYEGTPALDALQAEAESQTNTSAGQPITSI